MDVNKNSPSLSILDRLAVVSLGLETITMVAVAWFYADSALNTSGAERFLWGAAVVSLLFGLALAFVTWGFYQGRRFALGAAFAWQLLQAAAVTWLMASWPELSFGLLVTAAIVAWAVIRRVAQLPPRDVAFSEND